MIAQQHPMQAARLAALRAYDILDTPRESDFDDIVMLASRICNTPISVINLIDESRQWFKAETGLGVRETPLDTSICAHVILEDEFVEIPDTLADPRMVDNPLCLADPGLRFYAGALLKSSSGFPIGTLCVLDNQPRTLDAEQRDALRILANQVMTQLDLRAVIANEAVLRSEIDHRVKNSLSVVSAFVALERSAADNDEACASLDRVGRQIGVVAALHEHLNVAGERARIALAQYLGQAVELIGSSFPANVRVRGIFETMTVSPREASIVATIVNELGTNAVKHSFRDGGGTITIEGERTTLNGYRIVCRDDAEPSEAGIAVVNKRIGLGLKILNASVRQLNGTMTATRDEQGYSTLLDISFSDIVA